MRTAAAIVGVGAASLLLTASAAAHVTLSPAFVSEDAVSDVVLMAPNERADHVTTRLDVELPRELEVVAAVAPGGWQVEHTERRITWSGGRIAGADSVSFPVTLRGVGPAGAVTLEAVQGYEDGAAVTWRAPLTVLPATGAAAPREHPGRAILAAVVGVAVVAGSLLAVHRLRRRSLPDG